MMKELLDITDRNADYDDIYNKTFRTEKGLRAISLMYDDHSDDKNSYNNILKLKDNIHYRLFSATHQYLIFLRELITAESQLDEIYKEKIQFHFFPAGNPYFEKSEQELSSIFDSIVFQISSIFDYLSHVICYIVNKNKEDTVYWTKLARMSRAQNSEICKTGIGKVIDDVDRRFVGRLYDYRSRLLHHQRDKHTFVEKDIITNSIIKIKIIPSEVAQKHFKLIEEDVKGQKFTLTYLSSWVLKRTLIEIELILDAIATELKKNSHFRKNLNSPKRDVGYMFVSLNPNGNFAEPVSEGLWKHYKEND
jgi:hypothetical protein